MHEHPLQRFFKSLREQPVFAWERYQMRDVLVIDHPLCQAVFSRQGAQLLHFQPRGPETLVVVRGEVAAGRGDPWRRAGVLAVVWPPSERKRLAVPWLGAVARLEADRQQHLTTTACACTGNCSCATGRSTCTRTWANAWICA